MPLPSLRSNIIALSVLQVANYLIPLATLPYLTRVLGVESFGKVAFVQAVMAYFVLITDYGFSWSATRQIAAHRDDKIFISSVFFATWFAQWLLAIVSLSIMLVAIMCFPLLWGDAVLYAAGFTLVLGNIFSPFWLLQGMELMKEIAIVHVAGRLMVLPPLFVFVKGPHDAVEAIAIMGFGSIVAGVFSLCWIANKRLVFWKCPTWEQVREALVEGGTLFFSKLSISLYTMLTPLILGAVSGTISVGYFSLADTVRRAVQSLLAPISQALFPRMSHLYKNEPSSAHNLLKRSAVLIIWLSGAASLLLWVLSGWIIHLLGGTGFSPAAPVLRWLAFLPLIIGMSNILGVQVMLPNGLTKRFNQILGIAAVFSLLIIYPLILWKSAVGAAIVTFLTEALVTFLMALYFCNKKNYNDYIK